MRWGSVVSRFPDSPDSPSKTAPFNSLRPRAFSDYFSLEDKVVFWCYGAYKKYPRSYGADHRVCGDHCPTSGHSGPRTPVNDLKNPRSVQVYSFFAWPALIMKFCKTWPAPAVPLPTVPTYLLPYLWETKKEITGRVKVGYYTN